MSSFLESPMMQMAGGGAGAANPLAEFQAQMSAVDFPDGFPVQVITNDGGSQTTATLKAIDQNASFGADTWEPPAGYTKMDMPFIR
jgi:outer membrane lipoprotein-sorting protein